MMGHSGIVPIVGSVGELLAIGLGFLAFISMMTMAFVVALILLVRATVRRVRQDRRVGKAALMMQMHGSAPGPRRTVAHARLRLHESVSGVRSAVALLQVNGGPRGQLAGLVRRFEQAAGAFDAQLRLMQTEPQEHILERMLAPVDARLDQFEGIARQIRHTAFALLGGDLDATVHDLAAEVDREMRALQAGIDALHALRMGELSTVNTLRAGSPAGMPLHAMAKEHSR
jgi:hypothetical protein